MILLLGEAVYILKHLGEDSHFKEKYLPLDFRPRSRREAEGEPHRRQPYFISVSPDQRISPGGSVKLKCIAGGNPLPRLAWLLNGEVLVSLKYLWRIYLLNITQCSILLRSYALHCPFC